MKIINIDVKDIIELKNIEDLNTGSIKFIKSNLSIPADNVNNILFNFNFINPDAKEDGLRLFAVFKADNRNNAINIELQEVQIGDNTYTTACIIPSEVLTQTGVVSLGIYGYVLNDDESLNKRFSLTPIIFTVTKGSYDETAEEGIIPTPTAFEVYFNEVARINERLDDKYNETSDKIDELFNDTNNRVEEINQILDEKLILYKKEEYHYILNVGDTEVTIEIEDFSKIFNLIIDKNGLTLIENVDYTINYDDHKVILNNPIGTDNTDIHVIAIVSLIVNMDDFDIIKNGAELNNTIQELQEENEVLKNQIPTGQASGENITLNDSAEMEFKELRIGGNSWQETRSGKNLFNKDDYQLIKGYISNNVIVSEINNNIIYIPCLPNTTYAISKKAGMSFGVAYTDVLPEIGGSVEGWTFNNTGTSITITTGENANYLVVYIRNGNIAGEITLEEVLNSLQIEKNSVSTDYEEYGAMPSPEFRSEIQNVNGSANITVCNKNLFDYIKVAQGGISTVDGSEISGKYAVRSNYLSANADTNYTFSYLFNGTGQHIIRIFEYDENYNLIIYTVKTNVSTITIKTQSYTKYLRISIYNDLELRPDTYTNYFKNIQLEENPVKTDYIPHQSRQFTFPLSEGQRMYKDSYLADDGVHHKRGQIVLNGTENWARASAINGAMFKLDNCINAKPFTDIKNLNVLSSHFIKGTGYESTSIRGSFWCNFAGTGLRCIYDNVTLDEWKTFLSQQNTSGTPVIVEYELAEEKVEPYTEEQQLVYNEIKKAHSYKNVTHIFSTDEIKPVLDVTYRKDLETMFNNINTAIVSLGGV